jgi:predicted Zn finger-like uncharacterized protein
VFRVTAAQLALREGQVRCGHCRAVFDANDHFVTLDVAPPDEFGADDELLRGRPTVTLRSADALLPAPAPAEPPAATHADQRSATEEAQRDEPIAERTAVEAPAGEGPAAETAAAQRPAVEGAAVEGAAVEGTAVEGTAVEGTAVEGTAVEGTAVEGTAVEGTVAPGAGDALASAVAPQLDKEAAIASEPAAESETAMAAPAADTTPIELRDADRPQRFEWKSRKALGDQPRLYAIGIVALSLAIVVQLVLEFRDVLAAHVPATRVLLAGACRALSCSIEPLKETAALSIEASDLQADPAHRGLLVLSATIRNRASHPIAYPYLELTLTDSSERIVVRRAFAPHDYAGGTVDFQQGIAANGERLVKLFIDASATQQAGYQLYLFYP